MHKLLAVLLSILCVFAVATATQNTNLSTTTSKKSNSNSTRKPIFRATADQIKQAQATRRLEEVSGSRRAESDRDAQQGDAGKNGHSAHRKTEDYVAGIVAFRFVD